MTIDYAEIAADAAEAIAEAGFTTTLRRRGAAFGTEYDPVFGPDIEMQIQCIDTSDTFRDRASQSGKNSVGKFAGKSAEKSADLITIITRTLLVSTFGGVVPQKGDRVIVASVWHRINTVKPIAPGGVAVLFEVDISA